MFGASVFIHRTAGLPGTKAVKLLMEPTAPPRNGLTTDEH